MKHIVWRLSVTHWRTRTSHRKCTNKLSNVAKVIFYFPLEEPMKANFKWSHKWLLRESKHKEHAASSKHAYFSKYFLPRSVSRWRLTDNVYPHRAVSVEGEYENQAKNDSNQQLLLLLLHLLLAFASLSTIATAPRRVSEFSRQALKFSTAVLNLATTLVESTSRQHCSPHI